MKSLSFNVSLAIAIGGLVAAMALVFPWAQENANPWLIGCIVASVLGGVVLVVKANLIGLNVSGAAAVRAVLTAQVAGLVLRVVGVGLGAVVMVKAEWSPMAFVIPFFLVSLAQQALEMKSLLAIRNPAQPVKSEVTP